MNGWVMGSGSQFGNSWLTMVKNGKLQIQHLWGSSSTDQEVGYVSRIKSSASDLFYCYINWGLKQQLVTFTRHTSIRAKIGLRRIFWVTQHFINNCCEAVSLKSTLMQRPVPSTLKYLHSMPYLWRRSWLPVTAKLLDADVMDNIRGNMVPWQWKCSPPPP